MKATVDAKSVRSAMNVARIVKPMMKDFSVAVFDDRMKIWSFDRRRSVVGSVMIQADGPSDGVEYFLPEDRAVLFDSDLSNLSFSTGPKGMIIKFDGDGKSRSATVKTRAESSKRPRIPAMPDLSGLSPVSASVFEDVLRQVSCSALVKDTKTEEDMRINQIHFYPNPNAPESSYVTSNARFYATVVKAPGFAADFSMVSSDIPAARAFCARASGEVLVGSRPKSVLIADPVTGSWISFAKALGTRPTLSVPDGDCKTIAVSDRDDFRKSVKWCSMALEGTQRLTFSVSGNSVRMMSGNTELSTFPCSLVGSGFSTDLPVRVLLTIADHLNDGPVSIGFANSSLPDVVQISQESGGVSSVHFVKGMKTR